MSKNKNNQIKKVVSRVTFRQAEERDIEYWQNVSAEDKLSEVERLRKSYWSWKLGSYPQSMTKVVSKHSIYDI
jgi:hypothetical protein